MTEDDPVSALMRILSERWVMTLAQPDGDAIAATPLFFALVEPDGIGAHAAPLLVFATDPATRHGELSGAGPLKVGAAVYLESEVAGELRGAQLRGALWREDRCTPETAAELRRRYLERHPIAAEMLGQGPHRLYALQLRWGKCTDNRLGFGAHPEARFDGAWSGLR